MQVCHERITRDFGDHGCRRGARAITIGLDHGPHPQSGAARRGDVVVVAVEDDDRLFGHDTVGAQVREGAQRRQPQRAYDADLVDLRRARPPHGTGRYPRRGARGHLCPPMLGDELGVAQSLRHALAGARGVDHDGADRDGPSQGTAAHLVAGDQDRVLSQQSPLEGQARLRDRHFDVGSEELSGLGAGTAEKTT